MCKWCFRDRSSFSFRLVRTNKQLSQNVRALLLLSKLNFLDNERSPAQRETSATVAVTAATTYTYIDTFVCTITHFSNLILLRNIYDIDAIHFQFNGTDLRNTHTRSHIAKYDNTHTEKQKHWQSQPRPVPNEALHFHVYLLYIIDMRICSFIFFSLFLLLFSILVSYFCFFLSFFFCINAHIIMSAKNRYELLPLWNGACNEKW